MAPMHIKVTNLFKEFRYNMRDYVIQYAIPFFGLRRGPVNALRTVLAVNDVSFEIHEGERVGIIGKNGAGKTTLLTLLAGLAEPTSGIVDIEGRINCIMTLGVGLREQLTGRENIILDAEIHGQTHDETDRIIEEIIQFAELGSFIDQPVKTYSSGMKSRLSFAMITFIQPEILIIDEALSAGDLYFSQKATAKMTEITSRGKILIVVSHSMGAIVHLCNRCIWMEKGRIVMDGNQKAVTDAYLDANRIEEESHFKKIGTSFKKQSFFTGLELENPEFLDASEKPRLIFAKDDNLTVRLTVHSLQHLEDIDIHISFIRMDGIPMISSSWSDSPPNQDAFTPLSVQGTCVFEIPMKPVLLGKGIYEVEVHLVDRSGNRTDAGINGTLATSKSILEIENEVYPYENPAYWWPVEWRYETTSGDN
jgi:lipopolysaccharide transport system ATP-binding protein